jgi:hypothetical protein
MRRQPMRGDTGRKLAGALQRGPSEQLQRVSPGVYRNAQGQLTGPGGRPFQNMGQRIAQGMQGPREQNMGQNIAQGMQGPIAPSIAQQLQQGGPAQQPLMGPAAQFANEAAPMPNDTVNLAVQPSPNLPPNKMYQVPSNQMYDGSNYIRGPLPMTPERMQQMMAMYAPYELQRSPAAPMQYGKPRLPNKV